MKKKNQHAKELFEHKYHNTYYYATIVNNVLSDDASYLRLTSSFFDSGGVLENFIVPYSKKSAFQIFAEFIIANFFDEDMHETDALNYKYHVTQRFRFIPYASQVFELYGFTGYCFDGTIRSYEDVEAYHTEIYETGILESLYERISEEVFYLMFNNRKALLQFNDIVSKYLIKSNFPLDLNYIHISEKNAFLKNLAGESGYLKRQRIPEWCKKAVYFRDRGRCCLCYKDLSGILSLNNNKHYDHIVSLANGGLNDVANLQLLCSTCNTQKGHLKTKTSEFYEKWF